MVEPILIVSLAGVSIGSFLNTCAYRIPRGVSLLQPRSYCPACAHFIPTRDLIPLLSYIFLHGRCRNCKSAIPMVYPATEALLVLVTVLIFSRVGFSTEFITQVLFVSLMALIARIDWEHLIIPNGLIVSGLTLGLALTAFNSFSNLPKATLSAGLALLAMLAVRTGGSFLFKRESLGWGDVKLAAVMGLFIGFKLFLIALWGAAIGGAICGIIRQKPDGAHQGSMIPFGAFLAGAASLCMIFRAEIDQILLAWILLMQ